jgi:metal-sulfur cluster biosynthetic enzyme
MRNDGERRSDTRFVTPEMLLPEVVAKYPATRKVFDKYGLRGCGGPTGPREPVAWFARLHNVPLQQLLDELNEAARESLEGKSAEIRFEPTIADTIYQPYFSAAAAFAVVFGGLWGAILLAVMSITYEVQFAVPYGWILAHGQGMISGFVALMAMGFAFQAFPRFKHSELQLPKLAIAILPLMLLGLTGQILAHFFLPKPVFPSESPLMLAWLELTKRFSRYDLFLVVGTVGALLQWLAVTLFIVVVAVTLKRANKPEPYDPIVYASLIWLWLSALANIVLFVHWGTIPDRDAFIQRVGTWNAPLRDAQIFGFAAQLILGVSLRFLPHAYGFREPPRWWAKFLLVSSNLSTLALVISFPLYMLLRDHRLMALYWFALLAWSILVAAQIAMLKLFGASQEHDRALKFIRSAYLWAIVGLAMGLAMPIYNIATHQNFSHNYLAAYRHALLSGFILLMIVGVSSKVTPILAGVDLRQTNPLWTAFVLLNLGNILRVIGQTLLDFTSFVGFLVAAAGFVQWAGIILWADDLWNNIAAGRRIAKEGIAEEITDITPQTKVATVLERYPQTLEVFLRYGFAPLANPVLRKTMARVVTIEQACRREGVDMEALLRDLRKAAGLELEAEQAISSEASKQSTPISEASFHSAPSEATDFTEKLIWAALEGCYDPEIPDANIVELGLVYGVRWDKEKGVAEIRMTLTSPHCPVGDYILEQVRQSVGSVPAVREVRIDLTFDPPWSLDRIKPEVRQKLGLEW